MKSYQTLLSLYQTFSENTATTNQTLGAQMLNDSLRTIGTMRGGNWPWLERLRTMDTVASQRAYAIPASVRKIADIQVTVGTQVYMPEMIYDPEHWKLILAYNLGEGDIPLFVYQQGRSVLFAPIPATTGNTITYRSRENIIDLNAVDYTTGTITSIANAGTAVVGSGTSWTAPMVGRYIRFTSTSTDNGGDGLWYEISAVGSATTLTLTTPYQGTSIVAGTAAYTIGQMSPIPESYDVAPVYRAAALYWQMKNPDRAKNWWMMYDGGKEAGYVSKSTPPGGLIGNMLDEAMDTFEPGYIPPFGSRQFPPNGSLWGFPTDGSGF